MSLPIDNNTVVILGSIFSIFITVGFFTVAIEQIIKFFVKVRNHV